MNNKMSYIRDFNQIQNRLDVLYNHVVYDEVFKKMENSSFEFVDLAEAGSLSLESRDPQKTPNEEFQYIDIGSIDTILGIPCPSLMMGYEATSSRMRRVIHKGELLVSTTRPTRNAICIVPDDLDDQICTTGLAVIRPCEDYKVEYLFYVLRSPFVRKQIEKLCSGSGYPAINAENDLMKVQIPKASLDQQKEIVKVCEKKRRKIIDLNIKYHETIKAHTEGFLEELGLKLDNKKEFFLEKGRIQNAKTIHVFPHEIDERIHYLNYVGRDDINFLCQRMETVQLETICQVPVFRGSQPEYDEGGECIVIKTTDIKDFEIDYQNCQKVSDEYYKKNKSGLLQKGDILLASTGIGSLGRIAIYNYNAPAVLDGHVSCIRLRPEYNPTFYGMFLNSYYGKIQMESLFTGASGQIEIQPSDIGRIAVPSISDLGVSRQKQENMSVRYGKLADIKAKYKKMMRKHIAEIDEYIEGTLFQ